MCDPSIHSNSEHDQTADGSGRPKGDWVPVGDPKETGYQCACDPSRLVERLGLA